MQLLMIFDSVALTLLLGLIIHVTNATAVIDNDRSNGTSLQRRVDDWPACRRIAETILRWDFMLEDAPVDPKDAVECILSIQLQPRAAHAIVESAKRFVQYQSDIMYLKNPALGEIRDRQPVDIIKGLDDIAARISDPNNGFRGQWELEDAIQTLMTSARSGNLQWEGVLLQGLIYFERPIAAEIVSFSPGGRGPAEVHLVPNLEIRRYDAVTKINAVETQQFLKAESDKWSLTDAGARYNGLFTDLTWNDAIPSGFIAPFGFPGLETNFTLASGREVPPVKTEAFAKRGQVGWQFVADGQDPYFSLIHRIVAGDNPVSPRGTVDPGTSMSKRQGATRLRRHGIRSVSRRALPPSHPYQRFRLQRLNDGDIGGSVKVTKFDWGPGASPAIFERALTKFLVTSASHQTPIKLFLDLRGNSGGSRAYAYSLFLSLFPDAQWAPDAVRFRSHEGMNLLGKLAPAAMSRWLPFDYPDQDPADVLKRIWVQYPTNGEYPSWEALYGPNPSGSRADAFSAPINLRPFFLPEGLVDNVESQGWGFPHWSDITIITDGICSGACSLFVNLVTRSTSLTGVKRITVGGLPTPGPMPLVAGAKGALSVSLAELINIRADVPASERGNNLFPTVPPVIMSRTSVNMFDGYDPSPGSAQVPDHFTLQQSHCRIWHTERTVVDDSALYERVNQAALGSDALGTADGQQGTGFCGLFCTAWFMPKDICVEGSYLPPSEETHWQ